MYKFLVKPFLKEEVYAISILVTIPFNDLKKIETANNNEFSVSFTNGSKCRYFLLIDIKCMNLISKFSKCPLACLCFGQQNTTV